MTHGTKEKIMAAALKEFSKEGYAGAKTKDIAFRSGLSEMTLFRRFKSKKNLFNQVLEENRRDLVRDFNLILENNEIDNSKFFIEFLKVHLWDLSEKYFDFLSLIILEKHEITEEIINDLISILSEFLDEIFPKKSIDSKVLVFSILSFLYLSVLDKRSGRNIIDHENDFKKFVDYNLECNL